VTLHPFFAEVVAKNAGAPALSDGTPADARNLLTRGRPVLGAGPAMAKTREVVVPSRGGGMRSRLLIPKGDVSGVIVYFHGGGWVIGSIDDYDTLARELAQRSGCAVFLPDYRLAPEHPFPAGLEDAEDAILWMAENVRELFASRLPVVVAGDSAGGNLATVATRRLHGRVDIALQILAYPVTDSVFDTPSYFDSSDGMPLTRNDMRWFFSLYAPEELWPDANISPIRSTGLGVLPTTVVITAEYDVLRSDGEAYADALQDAGVETSYGEYPGMVHGFLRLHNHIDISSQAVSDIAQAIRKAIGSE
jgi:acetyl esterase